MSRRNKIIIAALLLLLLLALGLWFWLSRAAAPAAPVTNETVNVNQPQGGLLNNNASVNFNVNGGTVPGPGEQAPVAPSDSSAALKRLASAFAERYGSFSSLGDFENQTDLKPFMSEAFAARTDAAVAAERAKPPSSQYYGVTTRAVNAVVQSLDETSGDAVVIVTTQRNETTGADVNGTVKYQDIRITFIKEDGAWKADSARWL